MKMISNKNNYTIYLFFLKGGHDKPCLWHNFYIVTYIHKVLLFHLVEIKTIENILKWERNIR